MNISSDSSDISLPTGKICVITKSLIALLTNENEGHLDRLQTLDLHIRDANLGQIRRIENLHFTPYLKFLNLSYNTIVKMEGLGTLTQLIELNLAENAITVMEGITYLTKLQRLNLSGNRIRRIPESVAFLQSLEVLKLARNEVSKSFDCLFVCLLTLSLMVGDCR